MLRTLNPATASEKGYYFSSVIQIKGAAELGDGTAKDAVGLWGYGTGCADGED